MHSWPVLSELKGSHLLLARRPPSFMLDVLRCGRHWVLSRWRLVQSLPLRDRAASDRGPRSPHCYLRGRRCTAAPNVSDNRPTTACTATSVALVYVRRYVPALALLWKVMMALLTEQVPSEVYGRCDPCLRARTRDSRTEARTGPGPLYPRNGKRPHDYPENVRRHSELASTKTR